MTTARFPALQHARNLVARMLSQNPSIGPSYHHIILHGELTLSRHDTDRELPFRQESNFAYLSGCEIPGSALVVGYEHRAVGRAFDESLVESTLFLPRVEAEEVMWSGNRPTVEELTTRMEFTSIRGEGYTNASLFPKSTRLKTIVHTLPHVPFVQAAVATINADITHSTEFLLPALQAARRNKSAEEVGLMKRAAEITKEAHLALMKGVGRGEIGDENEAEAVFVGTCRKMGAKLQAYTPIVANGVSAGTLHYIDNTATFTSPSLLLVDAGAEYRNYAADITRCIPVGNGGRFTEECKTIYEIVLEMQLAAFEMIRPGASYEEIQIKMHRVLAKSFLQLGIFTSSSLTGSPDSIIDQLIEMGLTTSFYPHGVGHLLGLDVHDVVGLPNGKSKHPLCKYLRLVGVPLEVGFVVTVEPGIYFNDHLLAPILESKNLNLEILERYKYVGGVRIEDNLLITENGFTNFSTGIPKTVEEIEAITTARD